jgi:hypothetical protein
MIRQSVAADQKWVDAWMNLLDIHYSATAR